MSPDLLKAFFRAGVFVAGSSIFLLFIVQRDSAEYVVTIMSLCVGVILIGLVMLASWFANR